MKVKLADVCTCESSNLKQSDVISISGNYPVYGATGKIGYIDTYKQENPYIAIVKDGAGIGRTHLCDSKSSVIGTLQYILPKENVLPEYLFYVIKHMHLEKYYSGATIPHIYFKNYKNEEFNLTSINKQETIINILNDCNKLINLKEAQLQKYDELIKARFVEMFGNPVTNSMGWPEGLIGDNCFVTKLAGFEYTQYINYEDSGDVVMVKAQNVKNGKLNRKELSFISKKVSDSLPRSQLEPGDVVMTYVGANIGDVAVIDNEYKYHLAPNVAKIRPDAEVYNSIYFAYMLLFLNSYIVKNSADTAKAALGMDRIRKLHVFVPPIELQNQFADFVQQVDKSKLAVQQSLEKTQLLFDSLMQEYFGEN